MEMLLIVCNMSAVRRYFLLFQIQTCLFQNYWISRILSCYHRLPSSFDIDHLAFVVDKKQYSLNLTLSRYNCVIILFTNVLNWSNHNILGFFLSSSNSCFDRQIGRIGDFVSTQTAIRSIRSKPYSPDEISNTEMWLLKNSNNSTYVYSTATLYYLDFSK